MASETFTASQVCQIVTGDDGDLDYMFPGSDDDLGMEDMDDDELERQAESESDADAEIESTDGTSPDVENSLPSPSERNSDNSTSGRGRGRGRSRGRGRGRGCGSHGRRCGSRGRRQGNQRCHEATSASAEEGWSEGSSVQVQPFSMNVGPTFPLEEEPVAIFSALFTPQLLDHIVAETNRYATLCLTSTHKGEGPPPTWETDANEISAYLGFAILMGINRVPDLYDYWSTSELYHYFSVASRIPRKRFLELSRFLHFADNATISSRGDPGYDRLAKVRPVIETLRESFLSSYNPHRMRLW